MLTNGQPIMQCMMDGGTGTYVCQDFTPPGLGLIVVVTGGATTGFVGAGSAGQNISASTYKIDTYQVKKSDADAWGFDYATNGAFIAKFYSDAKPSGTDIEVTSDKDPVSGVTLIKDGGNANAKYFDATLSTVSATATTTSTSGAAIVASPIPMGGSFPTFTGMGGMDTMGNAITWETLQGGSAKGLILILRFHPN